MRIETCEEEQLTAHNSQLTTYNSSFPSPPPLLFVKNWQRNNGSGTWQGAGWCVLLSELKNALFIIQSEEKEGKGNFYSRDTIYYSFSLYSLFPFHLLRMFSFPTNCYSSRELKVSLCLSNCTNELFISFEAVTLRKGNWESKHRQWINHTCNVSFSMVNKVNLIYV